MPNFVRTCGWFISLPLMFVSLLANAEVEHRVSGFATLGLVSNSNPNLVFRRDILQDDGSYDGDVAWLTDSLVGAQWQTRWSHQVDTTVQVIAKDRFNNSLGNAVEWAFLRYRPLDGFDLRIGRLGTDIFMLSDYRQVGYAFPWARPPHDYYTILSLFNFDGIDLSKRFVLDDASLTIKLFYGNSNQKYPDGFRATDSVRLDFNPAGTSLIWEQNNWKLRYSYANVSINNEAAEQLVIALDSVAMLWPDAPNLAQQARTQGRHFEYHEIGLNYDNILWWLQAEATQLRSETTLVPHSDQAYLSIGRRFDEVSIFALGGIAKPQRATITVTPPTGYPSPIAEQLAQLAFGAERGINGVQIKQKSVGVGLRWDFTAKMALKFQLEKFHIDSAGTNLWLTADRTQAFTRTQTAEVSSITLDVLF